MSLKSMPIPAIPDETARITQAAFPRGTLLVQIRDALGTLYTDEDFADLFPSHGQPAEAPWRLALVSVLQFVEGLTDRQAADAVRSRLDWKYVLSLELADPGFDHTVLSEFRSRLVQGGAEQRLLDVVLEQAQAHGWLKERGRQRTDSTHVLAASRMLGRLEVVGETLRHALNVLAEVAPDWLRAQELPAEWGERYGRRIEEYRLPKGAAEREAYANEVGANGWRILEALEQAGTPSWLQDLPAVVTLRQVWAQQYHPRYPTDPETDPAGERRKGRPGTWRQKEELPPSSQIQNSPYDSEARYGKKREIAWVGYKAHLTETCDPQLPRLIVQASTTLGSASDEATLTPIHEQLAQTRRLPQTHLVDAGYIDADGLAAAQSRFQVDVVGPTRGNFRWQAREQQGFDGHQFQVDWDAQQAICPEGHVSRHWRPSFDRRTGREHAMITVKFSAADCRPCPCRTSCTRAAPRTLTLHPRDEERALRAARRREQSPEFVQTYAQRAGVEATHAQALRVCGLRRSRYYGHAKTHLHLLLTATALNLLRLGAWLTATPLAPTRQSAFSRFITRAA
ncbi:MAG: IS1182 family transposase [Ktedonobacterales bacterium]